MEKQFIPLEEASLAIESLEVLDDELILIRGGFAVASIYVSGCGCGCSSGTGCGCAAGAGCGCECSTGIGCGCGCDSPTGAPEEW